MEPEFGFPPLTVI